MVNIYISKKLESNRSGILNAGSWYSTTELYSISSLLQQTVDKIKQILIKSFTTLNIT